jgi:hypothetical protein
MLIHPKKFIFVHVPRTGGETIENYFLAEMGLDQRMRPALLVREKLEDEQGPPRLSHLTASQYTEYAYLSKSEFKQYYKFSVVRNPWSRVVSFYHYLGYATKMSFDTFVLEQLDELFSTSKLDWFVAPSSDFIYSSNDELLVDFVARFESYQHDFGLLTSRLKTTRVSLPIINSSSSTQSSLSPSYQPKPSYQSYYSVECRDKVALLYKRDVEIFGYSFNPD